MPKKYTISDGKMVLYLQPAGRGWYAVTSPLDPGITTQARSVEEAFVMAYDAQKLLNEARAHRDQPLKASRAARRKTTPPRAKTPPRPRRLGAAKA
jgi:predicted RNase H-like HicB family nuclease